jgi:hypothetical protein
MNLMQVALWPALQLLVENTKQWLGCGEHWQGQKKNIMSIPMKSWFLFFSILSVE